MRGAQIVIFFSLSLVIGYISYLSNPELLEYYRDYHNFHKTPDTAPVIQFKELKSDCQPTSQYRFNSQKQGAAPPTTQPRAKAQIISTLNPFNVGLHNASKSSPTIDSTGVYVGSDSGFFYKLSHSGEVLWSFNVPDSLNGFHGSAAMDHKKVYIGAYNGFMYALDKNNGDLIWANRVADYIGASPLLADSGLFISAETNGPDGLLARLDCNTGETQWVSKWLGGHSHSSPAYDEETKQVFVGANSGRFFAFSSSTGQQIWEKQFAGQIKGTPLIWRDRVIFGSWDKNYYALNKKNGDKLWLKYMGGRIQTSLTLVPGEAIGVTNTKMGEIVGMDLMSGDILWRLKHGDHNHQFSILVTKDPTEENSYLAWSRCKETKLCTLNAKTGKLIEHLDLPGSFTSIPSSFADKVYITLDGDKGLVILN